MTRCLTPTEIEALRAGKLSPKDKKRVEAHIAACDTCRSQVESQQAESQLAGDIKQAYQKETVSSPGRSPKSSGKLIGAPPKRIGPYHILELLGEGGMGIVYLAEQTQPVRRRVALKLIKLGMDTKQILARLEAERQALSMMNHPNVAKLLDAGATEQGRPYFVMELVHGVPITDYCDRHRLSTAERLELFMQVCQGIQHAHQKGIIHRDIKPSNVLVAVEGDEPVPKVIDFGVAKAIQQKLTERTLFTEQGQLIGTPEYMSPEQAEMTALDIDTRTDIYSLGVLLYELLVGALPFDPTSLRQAAFAEIQRIIREVEPPKPSTRLSSLGDESTTAAQKRHTDRTSLERQLRGDLDWITMKAIEKDRTRRYATAAEFADDIARHLRHEPVLASPPSAAYRARKFIRRNKGPVAATGILLAVLAGGVITSTTFAIQAANARDAAQRQLKMTRSINDFLNNDLLAAVAPEEQGKDVLMRDVLDTASEAIEGKFDDAPLIEASIRTTLGVSYRKLGHYSQAEPHLVRALETRRAQLGADHEDTLDSINNLAELYWYQGRFDEAEPLYVKTMEVRRRVLGEEHPDTLTSMNNLALLYSDQARFDEAEPLHVKALELKRRVLGEEDPSTLASINNLALLYSRQGRFDEAEPMCVKALELSGQVLGEEHPQTLKSMNNLANLYSEQGRFDEAEPLFVKTLELRRRVLGEEHPDTLSSIGNLARLYIIQGRYDQAEPLCSKTLELTRRMLGEEHPRTLASMSNLAGLYGSRYDQAEPLYAKALELRRRVLGEEHPDTQTSMNNLAVLYMRQGRYDEAEPLYVKTLSVRRRVLGEEHPETQRTRRNLLGLFKATGKLDQARPLTADVLAGFRKRANGPNASANDMNGYAWHLLTCVVDDLRDAVTALEFAKKAVEASNEQNPDILDTLALAQQMNGDINTAIETQTKAVAVLAPGPSVVRTELETTLVKYLLEGQRFAKAEPLLLTMHEQIVGSPPPRDESPAQTQASIERLANLYESWHTAGPGKGYDAKAAEWRAKLPPPQAPTKP